MQEHIIYELLAKYFADEATADERAQVKAWTSERESNRQEFDRMHLLWQTKQTNSFDAESALRQVWSTIDAKDKGKVVELKKGKSNNWFMRIAASLLMVVGLAAAYFYMTSSSSQSPAIAFEENIQTLDQIKELTLSDGTKVWVNKNSKLSYPKNFNGSTREVFLTGEAFFDVAKNPDHAFVIKTKDTYIKVLGTSFNIDQKDNTTEITVASGKVEFGALDHPQLKVVLLPNEKASWTKGEQAIHKTKSEAGNEMAWKTKQLVFKQAPMQTVLTHIEQFYDINIDLSNNAISNCRLNATFKQQSIESVMETIKLSLDLNVEGGGNKWRLVGKGCN